MSDTPLSAEKLNEERAFIKRYTEGLSGHKVEYTADFSTPLDKRPRKVAIVGVSHAAQGRARNTIGVMARGGQPMLTSGGHCRPARCDGRGRGALAG